MRTMHLGSNQNRTQSVKPDKTIYAPWRRRALSHSLNWLPALFVLLLLPALPSWGATASVKTVHSLETYPAGGNYPVVFVVHVTEPWFLHGPEESEGMLATRLTFPDSDKIEVVDIRFPPPRKISFPYSEKPLEVYGGQFNLSGMLHVPESVEAGTYTLNGEFFFQACSAETCRPPETVAVSLRIQVTPPGTPAAPINTSFFQSPEAPRKARTAAPEQGAGLWLTLLGIFVGGLALNLTPCIYPLIPITVSYFGGKAGTAPGHPFLHGGFYIVGLCITNATLGAAASLSGGLLGAALQNAYVLVGIALILIALALSFFGFWDLQLPSGLTGLAAKSYGGYFGTLFMGLTLGIVAAPCLGPFILGLLTVVGQKGDPVLGMLYFVVLSIGMGLPLAILGVFSGALNKLPLSGDWMVWVRKVLGWVLIGMAVYMISPLIPKGAVKASMGAVLICAAAIHLGWLDSSGRRSRVFGGIKKSFSLLCIAGAIVYLHSGLQSRKGVDWIPYQPVILENAARNEKPVMLDFYADWCTPCRQMDTQVFTNPEVVRLAKQFVPVKVDLTRKHPQQAFLQETYALKGVPTILFLDRSGRELKELRLESYAGEDVVLDHMKKALEAST